MPDISIQILSHFYLSNFHYYIFNFYKLRKQDKKCEKPLEIYTYIYFFFSFHLSQISTIFRTPAELLGNPLVATEM